MPDISLIDIACNLKSGLLAKATNGEYENSDFRSDLDNLLTDKRLEKMLPPFISTCRNADDFRRGMQAKFKSYAERRSYIETELEPIFQYLYSIKDGTDTFSENVTNYQLGERLGNGGFGTVYKYHHKLLDYDFAIKLFEPVFVSNEENLEGETRFFREAKVLFQLNHPNIVRVFDIGRIEGQPFIRMELVDGYNLQKFVEKYGTVSFERSLKPIQAILIGLAYAHGEGVIHRDLKPTNVMVTNDGRFKIIDFGISAYLEIDKYSKLTKTGESVVGGTFTDPVLIDSPKVRDIRSDIYSVGAIWYYLIVGTSPAGGDVRQTLLNTDKVTPLQAEIILKCLASHLEDRFSSCNEIISMITPTGQNNSENTTPINLNNKQITEITRDEIMQVLIDAHNSDLESYVYHVPANHQQYERVFEYSGRKSLIEFLKRIYDFDKIPSQEKTFEEELIRHTVRNDDYDYQWVFQDERLQWFGGNDEIILKFICEVFHPVVRNEKCDWKSIFTQVNDLLKIDGYELYEISQISNRSVYGYRYHI
ncbi:MAG: protein kinase [Bacteroidales bacterium]